MRDFNETIEQLNKHKITAKTSINIAIENAEELFYHYFNYFLQGVPMQQAKEYQQVIQWLKNNEGKSLFLYGNNGRGKTLIASKIIPAIFIQTIEKIFTIISAYDLADEYEDIKRHTFMVIDDFGTEPTEINNYGTKRSYINELIDRVEKRPSLFIITSNLGPEEIIDKYGMRTYDRIVGNFKRVRFGGENTPSGKDSFRN